jgi:hypothetical protein
MSRPSWLTAPRSDDGYLTKLELPVYSNGANNYVMLDHTANSVTAWWIAFGPHGPRATDPPGEWTRVWIYTAAGVAISGVVFFGIHSMARPEPRTMTKEWQEATNEYLKVSSYHLLQLCYMWGKFSSTELL